eukprot:8451055-Lingulodinium_polyedra.AAC.1
MPQSRANVEPVQLGSVPDGPSLAIWVAGQRAAAAVSSEGAAPGEPLALLKTDRVNAYGAAYRSVIL